MKTDDPRNYVLPDAWTDEQETSLFKSMIQCKPVGSFLCYVTEEFMHHMLTLHVLTDDYQACISTFV